MKILVKMPSRGRPKQLIKALSRAILNAENNNEIVYQLTLDVNDISTNNDNFNEAIDLLRKSANIVVHRGISTGKINACNRDMHLANPDWDIVVLLSDDMMCENNGWDNMIRQEMKTLWPDTDGLLFFNDGFTQDRLNTLTIMGRKYFERFNYLYHPSYKSLWCDNELMDVGYILEKQVYNPMILFKHLHPANTGEFADELYQTNDTFYLQDKRNFDKRKVFNFDL